MQHVKSALRRSPILWGTLKLLRDGAYDKALEGARAGVFRRGLVVSSNDLGVSNRIKCLISSMRLATTLNRQVAIFWPRNWACRCDFSDLFENAYFELDKEGVDRLRAEPATRRAFFLDTWGSLLCFPDDLSGSQDNRYEGVVPVLDFEYDKTPMRVRQAYLQHIAALRPINYIRQEVQQFAERFGEGTVSVSIRSWVEAKERADGLFDLAHVFDRLDNHEDKNFFVSCDSEDVLQALVRRYGRRVLNYPKRTGTNDRRSKEGMQDILIDMLLLAQNPTLIASYMSTYPEVAWWLGGCKATVELIEPPDRVTEWGERHRRAIHSRLNEDMSHVYSLLRTSR